MQASVPVSPPNAVLKRYNKNSRVAPGIHDVPVNLPPVVPHAKDADDLRAAMNLLPALAKSSPHATGRRRCHCNENEKGSKADRNDGLFENIFFYGGKKQALVEYEPGQEMHQDIKERE